MAWPFKTDVWNWVMGPGAGSVVQPVHVSTEPLLSACPPMCCNSVEGIKQGRFR